MGDTQQTASGNQNIMIANVDHSSINLTVILTASLDYQAMLKEKKQYEEWLDDLPPTSLTSRSGVAEKLREVHSKMERLEKEVIRLAASFEHSTISTERFHNAKALFAKGEFQLADDMLDTAEIDHDFKLFQEILRTKEQEIGRIEGKMQQLAGELIVKGKLSELAAGTDARDRMDAAESYFLKAVEISPVADINFEMAKFYARNGKSEHAEEILKQIKAQDKTLTLEMTAKVCIALVEIHLSKADEESLLYNMECIKTCQQLIAGGDKKYYFWLGDSYSNLGVHYSKKQDLNKSVEMFEKSISIRIENEFVDKDHNAFNQSITLYNLGLVYFDLVNYDRAIEQLMKAVEWFEHIDRPSTFNLQHKKQIFRWLGRTHYKKSDRKMAIEYFVQQIAVLEELLRSYPDYIEEIAETQWFIASKYIELTMEEEALDYFRQCIQNVRVMHEAGLITSCKYLDQYLLNIAYTWAYRSRHDLAKEFLEEANEIIRELDDPEQISQFRGTVERLAGSC